MWPAVDIPGQWVYVASACVFVLLSAGACWRGWRYDRARGRPRCYKCGYPVAPDDAQAVTEAVGRASCQQKAKRPRGSTREPGGSAAHASRAGCLSNQPKGADTGITEGGSGAWACPECGWEPRRVKDLTRTRRSRRWLAVSLLLLAGGTSCWYAIHVQFRRYKLQEPLTTAAVPTTWWLLVLPQSSGDEDIIVYHRAYPQGKMAGASARQFVLPGSQRQFTVASWKQHNRWGDTDVESLLPRWQHILASNGFAEAMFDSARPGAERGDKVWLFSTFSGLDTPHEKGQILSLLDEEDVDLLYAVLDECYGLRIASSEVAEAAARAIEDSRYDDGMREFATQVLGMCGELAVPYISKWIESGEVELDEYIFWTVQEASGWAQMIEEPIQPFLLQMLKLLLASPSSDHQDYGLYLLDNSYGDYWRSADAFYDLFLTLKPEFESLLQGTENPWRGPVVRIVGVCAENIGEHYGADDLRTVEAWGWLIAQPGEDVALVAAEGIRLMASWFGPRTPQNAEAHLKLDAIITEALEKERSSVVVELLEYSLRVLRAAEGEPVR